MREIIQLKTKTIKVSGINPRKTFSEDALEELAASIKKLGLLQPPVVYPDNGRYILLCGERRLLACKKAKVKEIPCMVIDPPATPEVALQLSLVENLQREDLRVGEEAPAIKELVEGGMKRSEVARALGKSYGYINARYQVALYPEVLAAFVEGGEEHVNQWALVGQIEGPEIRGRIIKDVKGRGISSYAGDLNTCRMIEKRAGGEIEERRLTRFCWRYKNKRKGIEKCIGDFGDWSGAERTACKHCVDVTYALIGWLGLKFDYGVTVCVNPDKTCLDYKLERERVTLEKLDRVDKKKLLRQEYRWGEDRYVEVSMDSDNYGPRACKGCKSLYRVPEGLRYSTEISFQHPYRYCLSEDPACFDSKKADWKAEEKVAKPPSGGGSVGISYVEAKKKTDDELREIVQGEAEEKTIDMLYGPARETLEERGFIPRIKVEVRWEKFEAPGACSLECHYAEDGPCPEYCPHQVDGEPKKEEDDAA